MRLADPTECSLSECNRETPIMRRPLPTGGCCTIKNSSGGSGSRSNMDGSSRNSSSKLNLQFLQANSGEVTEIRPPFFSSTSFLICYLLIIYHSELFILSY